MYDRILIPTDGSGAADKASLHAFNLAEKFDSELHVLYVVSRRIPPVFSNDVKIPGEVHLSQRTVEKLRSGEMPDDDETREKLMRPTEKIADEARDRGIKVVQSVRAGRPDKEIIDYTREYNVDMIVMGSHGKGSLDHMILGSTTDKVLKLSKIPVVVIDTYQS
ncbi:universal stress protein [Methanonatronarchaeum sp. AMET6-2]|uniref:universal stress protein n=1 Tax=Methanonatronarchaeum sp. AMET6-2 TaxID=2933293 RepID=UPI001FF53442|nr:universal stress protein [Methanonatronarchaeum sp. AMET6-2]UOY09936.1 universal stress protein [Methanonatronarchaeum sp. AMET6-2]